MHPCCCGAANILQDESLSELSNFYRFNRDNTIANAVLHCTIFCSVASSSFCSSKTASDLGWAHEEYPTNPKQNRAMDLYNNSMGITLAEKGSSVSACAARCKKAADNYALYWFERYDKEHPTGADVAFPAFQIDPNGNWVSGLPGAHSDKPPTVGHWTDTFIP